jgi:UTP-glucose-1-phosphate uridylyltransferase
MNPTLLILAAGMGSRYGGMKQIDPIGPNGAVLLDYAIYDARRAGFGKIVFVIKRAIEKDFKEIISRKYGNRLDVDYAFQELDKIPAGFTVPAERQKPWGTGHAVLVAKDVVKEPFAVINADDYYGASSYKILADFLKALKPGSKTMAMVGFAVENTLSENGAVSRGVCTVDLGKLVSVVEHEKIRRENGSILHETSDGTKKTIPKGTLVSMNFWGFTPELIFPWFEKQFVDFMKSKGTELKSEFYLPSAIDAGIKAKEMVVEVLATKESWFGLTYSEDKPVTRDFIIKKIAEGVYPENLFS